MQAAFVFDQDRCTGCEACRVACGIENGGGRDLGWRQIHTFNPARHPDFPTRHLSLACNHCERPACLLGCPAAAYSRDAGTGAVLLDSGACIGCRYCSWVCPYDVPLYDEAAGVMTKCTFCAPRLDAGKAPACAQACPTGALSHASRSVVSSEPLAPGLPALGLGPALVVTAPRLRAVPAASVSAALPPRPALPRKIQLRSERGLVFFTLVMPALVAWFLAGLLRPGVAPWAAALAGAGAIAMGVSTLHLGKPLRAWRALLNVRTSWLAREILFSSAFLVTATAARLLPGASPLQRGATLLALSSGAAAVVAIDALYRQIPRTAEAGPGGWRQGLHSLHSAEAWTTVPLLAGLGAGAAVLWVPAAALKAILLLRALRRRPEVAERLPAWLLASRAVALLAASALAALAASGGAVPAAWPVLLALAGEAVDRCRFYVELEPTSPGRLLGGLGGPAPPARITT